MHFELPTSMELILSQLETGIDDESFNWTSGLVGYGARYFKCSNLPAETGLYNVSIYIGEWSVTTNKP